MNTVRISSMRASTQRVLPSSFLAVRNASSQSISVFVESSPARNSLKRFPSPVRVTRNDQTNEKEAKNVHVKFVKALRLL